MNCKYFLHILCYSLLFSLIVNPAFATTLKSDPRQGLDDDFPQEHTQAEIQYGLGLTKLQEGNLQGAEESFKESLKSDKTFVDSVLGLAEISLRKKDMDQGGKYLQQALNLAPHNALVQSGWGRYLTTLKKFKKAEAAFKKASSLEPNSVLVHLNLGDLYLQGLQQPKKAAESYRAALKLDPNNAGAHYALGKALSKIGQLQKAELEFKEATRLAGSNPLAFQELGEIYTKQNKLQEAMEAFNSAIKAHSTFSKAYMGRGEVYLRKGKNKKALRDFSEAVKIEPSLDLAYVKMGLVYERQKQFEKAKQSYLTAIEKNSKRAVAYSNLAWISATQKTNLDQAKNWAITATTLAPKVSTYHDTLGYVYWVRGELKKALPELKKAASLNPGEGETFYHLGLVYSDLSNTTAATSAFRRALELKNFHNLDDAKKRLTDLSKS